MNGEEFTIPSNPQCPRLEGGVTGKDAAFMDRLIRQAESWGMREEKAEKHIAWLFMVALFVVGLPFGIVIFSEPEHGGR